MHPERIGAHRQADRPKGRQARPPLIAPQGCSDRLGQSAKINGMRLLDGLQQSVAPGTRLQNARSASAQCTSKDTFFRRVAFLEIYTLHASCLLRKSHRGRCETGQRYPACLHAKPLPGKSPKLFLRYRVGSITPTAGTHHAHIYVCMHPSYMTRQTHWTLSFKTHEKGPHNITEQNKKLYS